MDKHSPRFKVDYDGMGDFSRIPVNKKKDRREEMTFSHKFLNFVLSLKSVNNKTQ